MSHVDEGTLHAYLDGELETVRPGASAALEAHVAACDECRARLDDERRVRDRAHAVLGYAAPAPLEVPPFDAVLRRARGGAPGGGAGPASPRRRAFPIPLAWAASIVLALAGGWWAREMAIGPLPASRSVESADLDAVAGAEPVQAPAPTAARARSAGSAAAPADAAAKPSGAAQAGPAREPERVDAGRVRPEEAVSTPPPTIERRAIAGTDARQRADSAAPARVSAFAPPPAADSGGVLAEPRLSALTGTTDAATLAAAARAAGAAQWSAVDRAEAERRLGGRLLLVEGLEVQSIEVADTAGLPLVRTRQTVAPGVGLVLLQHAAPRAAIAEAVIDEARAAAPVPAPPGAPAPAPAALIVERSGFLVRLSADLPRDSLRALAGRLR